MNILIITTYFVPDSAISAIRPYMFAKHLARMGENVTVLRSGEFELPPFDEYDKDMDFEVISALGKNCDAERFIRGEYEGYLPVPKGRYSWLPQQIKMPLKFIRDLKRIAFKAPPKCFESHIAVFIAQKRAIECLIKQGRRYDVVFSTCGNVENIYSGKYAAERFNATWIMDFRDSMTKSISLYPDFMWNVFAKRATICALKKADFVTAVSNDLCNELKATYPRSGIYLLYNGYDENEEYPDVVTSKDVFSFCYAGRMYEDRKPALSILVKSIAHLIAQKRIDRNRVRFYYAGSSAKEFLEIFRLENVSDIVVDKGYLSKAETFNLELACDVFTVLSWNTTKSKGILTGKFYEGIKARKPILTIVSGNAPGSELMQLQKKYQYGFCYEICGHNVSKSDLEEYIESLYVEKIKNGGLSYLSTRELKEAFCYGNIVEKLLAIIYKAKK